MSQIQNETGLVPNALINTSTGTATITVDASAVSYVELVLTGNVQLVLTGFAPGKSVKMSVAQDGTGGRTLTTGGGSQTPAFMGATAAYTPNAAANQRTFYDLVGTSTGAVSVSRTTA